MYLQLTLSYYGNNYNFLSLPLTFTTIILYSLYLAHLS